MDVVNCLKTTEPLGSSLFATKFVEIPVTHFLDLRKIKGWVEHKSLGGFEQGTPH